MGSNYYVEKDLCECCGEKPNRLHIGKSSCGWVFSLHQTEELQNIEDWLIHLSKNRSSIVDEYGRDIPFAELINTIMDRSFDSPGRDSEPGLLYYDEIDRETKRKLSGNTWAMTEGEFS